MSRVYNLAHKIWKLQPKTLLGDIRPLFGGEFFLRICKTTTANIFYFPFLPEEMIQFDEHIFQMGWFNHQLDNGGS